MVEKVMEISGTYDKTLFRDEKTGFTVFSLRVKRGVIYRNMYGTISCCGKVPVYTKGMPIVVSGTFELRKYGMTFILESVKEHIDDKEISISYLSTNLCKGIGRQTATLIVDTYGADIFDFVQKDNAVFLLTKIKGITETKAEDLVLSIKNTISQRQLFEYIAKFGGSYTSSIKIAEEYGYMSVDMLKSKPYKVGHFGGLSFIICDAIARECGFTYLDPQRIEALIYEALSRITSSGNTYTTQKELNGVIGDLIKESAFMEDVSPILILTYLTKMNGVVVERDIVYYDRRGNILSADEVEQMNSSAIVEKINHRIYLKQLYYAEKNSVFELNRLNTASTLPFNDDVINYAEEICNIEYSDLQKEAFNVIKTTGVKIITGGPGTGKTTTIKGIIEAYKKLNPISKVALCAPTGRAAQRMKESTGYEAFTVHKLLEYRPFGREVSHKDSSNPIDADFIIVDEFSMIDIEIFAILLNAIRSGSIVLLVGDSDQLPSVGPGNVLYDLMNSGKIELHRLESVYRQGEGSNIIVNADKVRFGETNLNNDILDFEVIRVEDTSELKERLKETVIINLTDNPYDVQVLSSTKKNEVGTVELNDDLQTCLNDATDKIVYGNTTFRKHDKIIMTQNNYEIGYYNGDIGTIVDITPDGIVVLINEEETFLPRKAFDDISLAYAITIHKSQGSEFPLVIIALPKYPKGMLQRNLIFTAITRAKEKVIIITEKDALETAILRTDIIQRNTGLLQKLLNEETTIVPQRKKDIFSLF